MTESSKPRLAPIYENVLEMIGNTPMLELTKLDTGPCRLFVNSTSIALVSLLASDKPLPAAPYRQSFLPSTVPYRQSS